MKRTVLFSLLPVIVLAVGSMLQVSPIYGAVPGGQAERATVAVLSHTDFLPDATGVYDRRSSQGRDKAPGFVDNDARRGSDQAYDNVERRHGYDPEAVGLPEVLADAILEQLSKSRRFIPVERKSLRTAILEQRFGQNLSTSYSEGALDKVMAEMDQLEPGGQPDTWPKVHYALYKDMLNDFRDLGTALGAQYLVLGNLHQLGSAVEAVAVPGSKRGRTVEQKTAEARLRLRVIDAQTSTILGADSLSLKVSSLLFDGGKENRDDFPFLEQVAHEAANKILDMVFPARVVSVNPLVISRGTNDGISAGGQFRIIREGEEIKETSGMTIARLKYPVGLVEVIDSQETVSVASPVEGSGFVTGDLAVRVVEEPQTNAAAQTVPLQKPETAQSSPLPRVAVGLVRPGSTAKTGPEADQHVAIFTDTILTRLVQSRRFTVIDRQEIDQLLDEQTARALAENRQLPSVMGSLSGCDYLILGALQNFSIEQQSLRLPNSSKIISVLDGFAEGNMRLVEALSGDIMESRKVSITQQLEFTLGRDRLITALADDFADQVVANLLNAVYPVKVAAIGAEGTVYVNRGTDGLLLPGAVYTVLRAGQSVIDPDTGVSLGTMNTPIGQLELDRVEENRSLGKIISGSGFASGDLLQLVTEGSAKAPASPAPPRKGPSLEPYPATPIGQAADQPAAQPEGKGRPTLALTKITLNEKGQFDQNIGRITGNMESTHEQLTDLIIDALAKTNRFTMMERRQIDQILDEKIFQALAQGADIRQYLQELEGSDYLVVGELTNFTLNRQTKKVPYLDTTETLYRAFISGNHRIIDSHTSAVVATEKVRIDKTYRNLEPSPEQIRTELLDLYASQTADGLVRRIFPIKILGVSQDGTVFINRGADAGFTTGATFSVERPGRELIDPDTGISFGPAETPIGTIQLTSIEPFRSRAVMLDGGHPAAGDILRNEQAPVKPPKDKIKVPW